MNAVAFDFLTGCREFKRCAECRRTLQNSFASWSVWLNILKLISNLLQWSDYSFLDRPLGVVFGERLSLGPWLVWDTLRLVGKMQLNKI